VLSAEPGAIPFTDRRLVAAYEELRSQAVQGWRDGPGLALTCFTFGDHSKPFYTHSEIKLTEMCCSIKDVIEDNTVRREIRLRGAKV
jgi:hypothetical protein